jgi:hypothetical protein
MSLRGRVRAFCLRPDGSVRSDSVMETHNLITTAGLDALAVAGKNVSGLTVWAGVGSGSTAPSFSDTTLQTPVVLGGATRVSTTHTGDGTSSNSSNVARWVRARKFAAAVSDVTLREFGFFELSSGGTMWNRELFRNGGGDPIDYTVLAGEELVLQLTVELALPVDDVATSFVLTRNDGTPDQTTDVVIRLQSSGSTSHHPGGLGRDIFSATSSFAWSTVVGLVARTSNWTIENIASSVTVAGYVAGSFYLDCTYVLEPANGSATLNRFAFPLPGDGSSTRRFQMSVSPGIPKTSARRLRMTIRYQWGRG